MRNQGPFAVMFERRDDEVVGYLELLGLNLPVSALTALRRAVDGTDDVTRHVEALFSDGDWRPHLVGAVATLMVPDPAPIVPSLWRLVDTWSWVTPQICVVLSLVDPSFVEAARGRFLEGGRLPNPKAASSLLGLLRSDPAGVEWVALTARRAKVRALVEQDRRWDRSDETVRVWRQCLLAVVREEPALFPRLAG